MPNILLGAFVRAPSISLLLMRRSFSSPFLSLEQPETEVFVENKEK